MIAAVFASACCCICMLISYSVLAVLPGASKLLLQILSMHGICQSLYAAEQIHMLVQPNEPKLSVTVLASSNRTDGCRQAQLQHVKQTIQCCP